MFAFYPQYPARNVLCLDGLWNFAFLENYPDPAHPDFSAIRYTGSQAVPGVFDALPELAGKRGTAFYRTTITLRPHVRLLLKSGGLGMWGSFFWDGRVVGVADLPYSGMEFEFESGEGTEHELVVVIDNRFDFQRQPLLSPNYDFYCHGGIFRSLFLHELPEIAIDRAQIRTPADGSPLHIRVLLSGKIPERVSFTRKFDAEDPVSMECPVNSDGSFSFNASPLDSSLWSPESPNLHTLQITLSNGDSIVERFGIRTIEAKAGSFLLNGKVLKLRGFCRHEAHPEFGPALPLQILVEDLQLLRQTGSNFIRGSHYPQDSRFLDMCDEAGILVWEETLGWGDRKDHLLNPAFHDAQLRQIPWMVKKSFNHPCVILWGFLNEGDSSLPEARPLYKALADSLRASDETRPITYATMFHEKDINLDLVDVIAMNAYPGWYSGDPMTTRPLHEIVPRIESFMNYLHKAGFDEKPFLLSEIGAGAIYGWRDRFHAHWSEEYQADYLDTVCSCVESHDRISGVALWQFLDCRTYSTACALGRPRAFNNKGLFDEYRRPKLAFDVVRRHFTGK